MGEILYYPLTTTLGDRFASCENIVSRSQTLSLPPLVKHNINIIIIIILNIINIIVMVLAGLAALSPASLDKPGHSLCYGIGQASSSFSGFLSLVSLAYGWAK